MSEETDRDQFSGATTHHPSPITHHWTGLVPIACSCAALAVAFLGLLQLDQPMTRYVRSVTVHVPGDQLIVPWMAFASNTGDWIGNGWRLIGVSVVLLAAGWSFSRARLTQSGIETALAHGLAALLSNGLKHLLGRPRPKFVHAGEWQLAPSLTSGLDSFPSGHTTATFAVATVLAKRFPITAPIVLGIAAFVGVSRVLRGSHFPTDVFAGMVLGVVSGSIAAAPWKEWRTSLEAGIVQAGIGAVGAFSLVWVLSQPADEGFTGTLFVAVGLLALAGGFWLRTRDFMQKAQTAANGKISLALIAYGLASMTTAPLVIASVGLMCLVGWFYNRPDQNEGPPVLPACRTIQEAVLAVGILLGLVLIFTGRGAFPFQ